MVGWLSKKKSFKKSCSINEPILSGTIKLYPNNFQHIGRRMMQEDSFAFSDLGNREDNLVKGILAVVADGMGGLDHGEKASQTAVDVYLREYFAQEKITEAGDFLIASLVRANAAVYDLAFSANGEIELGTTLIAILIFEGKLHWVSVGDSRIYLYRNKSLCQLTEDHIYGNHLDRKVATGEISREEALKHPERAYLTGYLGLPELKELSCNKIGMVLNRGDVLLLCSDGLYNSLSDFEIKEVIERNPDQISEKLGWEALAKNNPYQDNLTILSVSCY